MFKKIRYRLLLNNLFVFILVLAGFVVAVRLVFMRNLTQQLSEQLTALGKTAIGESEIQKGRLGVEDDFLSHTLIETHQSLEWFNLQRKSVEKIGEYFPNQPLDPQAVVETQDEDPPIQSVTLPIVDSETKAVIGYVRVSQLLDEFDETVFLLDIGLGIGAIAATFLSSAGIFWLNRQAMQPIEDSFQRLKQFTADASHEFRSPLMAISSNVEVALKYPEGMRDEDLEAMNAVASAADQMTRLTEDLLLLARTDSAVKLTQDSENLSFVNLTAVLKELVQMYKPQSEIRQIALMAEIEPELWTKGSSVALTRAFTNLLQNAIRYTEPSGSISLTAVRRGPQLQIRVQDTGTGIAAENLTKIFERFWRTDQARSYDGGGSGLGLPITQTIIKSHGGTVLVTSKLGVGSSFTVTLPAISPYLL